MLHTYFLRFSPSVVPRSAEGQRTEYTRSDVVFKTIWYRVIHREKWLSTGFSTGAKKHRKAQNAQKCTERAWSENRLFEYTIKQRSGTFRRCKRLFFIKGGVFYTFTVIFPFSGRVVASSHSTPYFPPLSPNFRSPFPPFPPLQTSFPQFRAMFPSFRHSPFPEHSKKVHSYNLL